ncbi:protein ELC-like [Panicum hallii]|jgi:ESCRT-I complex subunit TSG101|uniref:protein ELC-like n=1 Tax=Panicum hallii TaxID=206008 RepID=UPI000DF4E68E|nr:protein ELC-like [Panicum hallii]
MATAAAAGTVVLVDAALAPYEHPDLRWLVRKHVLAVLQEFPTLSPSVDTYTSDDGASTVLLNARGPLPVSPALPPVLLTVWLPREYPYRPPLVYAFPAAPSASLVPDHPFVDHRTGRVHRTLPYLEDWAVPRSSLAGLVRSLVAALRMCHPLTATFGFADATTARATPVEEERRRMHAVLVDELASRLGRDAAAFRGGVDRDIHALSSLQAGLRARGDAMGRGVRGLEEERMRLERAVTASLAHRGELLTWLRTASRAPDPGEALAPHAAAGDAARWLESKASELAADDAMDALGHALENGELSFQEYIKRVKVLAREQFFHCYAASTSMNT